MTVVTRPVQVFDQVSQTCATQGKKPLPTAPTADPQLNQTWWRLALILSGLCLFTGRSLHPSRLNNSAHHDWASREILVLFGVALLVAGLEGLRRQRVRAPGSSRFAAATLGVASYGIEAVFHLFPYVDTDQLGTAYLFAPIGFLHLMFALAIYPISGLAISYLAHTAAQPPSSPRQRVLAGAGITAGLLHALSMPLAIFTTIDTGPTFTAATTMIAVWIVSTALTSSPNRY